MKLPSSALSRMATVPGACRQDIYNQPKAKPDSETEFFSDGTSARLIPPQTVERGGARENDAFYTGLTNETLVAQLPIRLTPELLVRGRESIDIVFSICHVTSWDG